MAWALTGGKAGATLDQFAQAGAEATARLREAETTLADLRQSMARADTLMASLEQTSTSVDAFVKGDAAALAAEARGTLESARGLMAEDLPPSSASEPEASPSMSLLPRPSQACAIDTAHSLGAIYWKPFLVSIAER